MSEKTILVSGAFNPLHFGHLLLLKDASKYGEVIVALNSDEWVLKNKGYLLFDFETRKSLLEECKYVSKVMPFDDSEGDVTSMVIKTEANRERGALNVLLKVNGIKIEAPKGVLHG